MPHRPQPRVVVKAVARSWQADPVHRWTDLSQVPDGFGPSVVTIGNFDGVHRGHRSVLGRMVATAHAIGGAAIAVTFDPHPAQVHRPDQAPSLITGLADRLELLEQTGIDAVLVIAYTPEFAAATAEDFVRTYLVEGLGARVVVVGHDVRFGRGNAGDLATMMELGRRYGFDVEVLGDVRGPVDPDRRWSSTWVRELLAAGDVERAGDPRPAAPGARRRRARRRPGQDPRVPHGQPGRGRDRGRAGRRRLRRLDAQGGAPSSQPGRLPAGRDLGRHQPDLRGRAPTGRGTRPRPQRPGAVRRGGRAGVRRPAAPDGPLRDRRGARRADGRRRRTDQGVACGRPARVGWLDGRLIACRRREIGRGSREPGWTCPGAPRNESPRRASAT